LLKKLDSSDSGVSRDVRASSEKTRTANASGGAHGDDDSGTVTDITAPITPAMTNTDTQQIIANLMDFKVGFVDNCGIATCLTEWYIETFCFRLI